MSTDQLARPDIRSSVNWNSGLAISEAPFIQRLALAFDFGIGANHAKEILDFGFHNVLDVMSPLSLALWRYESGNDWILLSATGRVFPLPENANSWSELNQASVLLRRPAIIHATQPDSSEKVTSHWAVPVIVPGRSCYVLHLLSQDAPLSDLMHESFLQSFTYLVVNSDKSDSDHQQLPDNGDVNHEGLELTDRQKIILNFLAEELTYEQIALRMGFSVSTIKQDSMKIFRKLGVSNRAEAVRKI